MSETHGRIVESVRRGLGTMAVAHHRRPALTLTSVALVTVLALVVGRKLTVDADLSELLPNSFPSVQALELLKDRFGGVGYLVVVGMEADTEHLRKFAEDLAPRLEALETVRYVDFRRPTAFLEDHALYFLEVEDLETIAERLEAREAYERRNANPLYLDLEDDSEPPSVAFEDLQTTYAGRGDRQWVQAQLGEPYFLDPDKRMVALFCKPAKPSIDLAFVKSLNDDVKRLMRQVDTSEYGDIEIGLTGRYVKRLEQQAVIERDLAIASSVAFLLVLIYLAIHFRRLLAVVLIITPLLLGLIWTLGFAALTFGGLNILSAFISVILIGLGIDHGIHLLSRYQEEVALEQPLEDAIRSTFGGTGRAIVIAGVTTLVGFAGLGISEFRAFREFGVIAAGGMFMLVTAYLVTLPALLAVAARLGWKPRRPPERDSRVAALVQRWPGRFLLANLLIMIIGITLIPATHFDYDFRALENSDLPSFHLDLEVNEILGFSQTPSVVLTSGEEQERNIVRQLREHQAELGDNTSIAFIAANVDMVPENQEAKRPAIARIGAVVEKIKPRWLPKEMRHLLEPVRRMVRAEPFTFDTLPVEVRRQFQGVDSLASEGFALIFPSISLSDGLAVRALAEEIRGIPELEGRANIAAGETMILADILSMVIREAPRVLMITLILVFLTSWILLGRLRDTALCLAPAILSLAVTVGIMSLVGLELNYLNIVMIPVLFGVGVDGGAHIVTRLGAGHSLTRVFNETGMAISGAILTTTLGFGAMILADHPGLDSLGKLSVLGLASNLMGCLLFLPSFLAWRASRRGTGSRPDAKIRAE